MNNNSEYYTERLDAENERVLRLEEQVDCLTLDVREAQRELEVTQLRAQSAEGIAQTAQREAAEWKAKAEAAEAELTLSMADATAWRQSEHECCKAYDELLPKLADTEKRCEAMRNALLHAPTPADYRLLIIGIGGSTDAIQNCILAANEYEALYEVALSDVATPYGSNG